MTVKVRIAKARVGIIEVQESDMLCLRAEARIISCGIRFSVRECVALCVIEQAVISERSGVIGTVKVKPAVSADMRMLVIETARSIIGLADVKQLI